VVSIWVDISQDLTQFVKRWFLHSYADDDYQNLGYRNPRWEAESSRSSMRERYLLQYINAQNADDIEWFLVSLSENTLHRKVNFVIITQQFSLFEHDKNQKSKIKNQKLNRINLIIQQKAILQNFFSDDCYRK
jgi:hypothetical protein